MTNVVSLSGLSTREAIQDAVLRCVLSVDTADQPLFDSSFFPNGIFDFNGEIAEGLPEIHKACYHKIANLDTTHCLSNFRIDYKEGDRTASLTCFSLAEHFRPGEGRTPEAGRYTAGAIYYVDVARDGDIWRMKKMRLKTIWSQGDISVFASSAAVGADN